MPANHTYDKGQVNLSMFGLVITGGGTGGFVSVTMPQQFDAASGTGGESVSFKTNNFIADGKLTLLREQEENEWLTAILKADISTPGGSGVGDFLLENIGSGFELSGKCRLNGPPDEIQFSNESADFVWSFKLFDFKMDYRNRG
jgi:hypothetical protein